MAENKTHQCYKGWGRPVLIDVSHLDEKDREDAMTGYLPDGRAAYIGIPFRGYLGSDTYFDGVDKITKSCGLLEYDVTESPLGLHYYGEDEHDKYHAEGPDSESEICYVMGILAGCKGRWPSFIYADNDLLKCHLNSPKVGKLFKELALMLMEKLDY